MNLIEWELIQQGFKKQQYGEYTLEKSGIFLQVSLWPNGIIRCRRVISLDSRRFSRPTEEGPAYETFYENGLRAIYEYAVNGKLHRPIEDGPAYAIFNIEGVCTHKEYYLYGEKIQLKETGEL